MAAHEGNHGTERTPRVISIDTMPEPFRRLRLSRTMPLLKNLASLELSKHDGAVV